MKLIGMHINKDGTVDYIYDHKGAVVVETKDPKDLYGEES